MCSKCKQTSKPRHYLKKKLRAFQKNAANTSRAHNVTHLSIGRKRLTSALFMPWFIFMVFAWGCGHNSGWSGWNYWIRACVVVALAKYANKLLFILETNVSRGAIIYGSEMLWMKKVILVLYVRLCSLISSLGTFVSGIRVSNTFNAILNLN